MRRLWQNHPRVLAAFALSLALALFFATRLVVATLYWADHRQEAVQPWMTVGYIGRSWQLDPHEIDARAGLPLPEGNPLTLQEIADARGVPVADIIAEVERTIAAMRAEPGLLP